MSSTLIPACLLCGLRFANRQLLDLHIREDHLQRNHYAEPDHHHSGDPGDRVGETGSAAGSVADEFEPRGWPYRLPTGWRSVTELDRSAVSAQRRPDGSQECHRQRGPGRRAALPDPDAESPTLRDGCHGLAERAGAESWTHDQFFTAGTTSRPESDTSRGSCQARDRLTYPQTGRRAHSPGRCSRRPVPLSPSQQRG